MIAAAALFAFQTPVDPMKLEIGSKQLVNVQINRVTNTATGEHSTLEAIAAAADGKKFVYIGEEHDSPDAHRWQALIIGALVKRGRDVVIGMEMYQRPKQGYLDMWTLGKFTEEQFLVESDWQGQWGFAWDLYRPIFVFAKENGLRMVGLNVPRDWVRTASRTGYDALPNEAKSDLPEMYLGNQDHKRYSMRLSVEAHILDPGWMACIAVRCCGMKRWRTRRLSIFRQDTQAIELCS